MRVRDRLRERERERVRERESKRGRKRERDWKSVVNRNLVTEPSRGGSNWHSHNGRNRKVL